MLKRKSAPVAVTRPKLETRPLEKYVSMFRIDGIPILPPVMTPEKRKYMSKLREKAIKIERVLEEKRANRSSPYHHNCEMSGEDEDNTATSTSSIISQPSTGFSDAKQTEIKKLNVLLDHMLVKSDEEAPSTSQASQSAMRELRGLARNVEARFQKLRKSETIVYDNISNVIIKHVKEAEEQQARTVKGQTQPANDVSRSTATDDNATDADQEEKANLNSLNPQKPNYASKNTDQQVPTIQVEPPTPLVGTRTFCDTLSITESRDAIADNRITANEKFLFDDMGSDESLHSDTSLQISHDLRSHNKVTNITAKIIRFESLPDSNPSDNHTEVFSLKSPQQRSCVSPTTQPAEKSSVSSLEVSNSSQTENTLIRSNSFTLENPSKALVDYLKQQQDLEARNRTNSPPSTSLMRDTVESKAKRVQKVENKLQNQRVAKRPYSSNSNYVSPYASTGISHTNTMHKRSPYDHKQLKSVRLQAPKTKLKRTNSSTLLATKSVRSRFSLPTGAAPVAVAIRKQSDSDRSSPVNDAVLHSMDPQVREKFLKLIAEQEAEQKRMQESFQQQQRLLLAELAAELSKARPQSPQKTTTEQQTTSGPSTVPWSSIPSPPSQQLSSPERQLNDTNSKVFRHSFTAIGGPSTSSSAIACDRASDPLPTDSNNNSPRRLIIPNIYGGCTVDKYSKQGTVGGTSTVGQLRYPANPGNIKSRTKLRSRFFN